MTTDTATTTTTTTNTTTTITTSTRRKMRNEFLVLLLVVLIVAHGLEAKKRKGRNKFKRTMSDEKLLTKYLLERYEEFGVMGRPVVNTSSVVDVRFGISLIQILELDAKNQVLTTNIWSRYTWVDDFMRWNPSRFGGMDNVRVPSSRIWTPDIVLYNYADTRLREHRDSMLVISNNGTVLWIPPSIYKSTCKIDITHFPFDVQTCSLKFGSWTHDGFKLNVDFYRDEDEVDVSDYVPSNEWGLIGYKANRHLRYYTCCIEPYPDLTFTLHLKRVAAFYHYILILPCILLSFLTLVIFWLPPESPAKILLGMNIFVAFFVLLLLLADVTPPAVTRIPLIGAYFCLNMVLITLSTFLAVIVINTYIRGDKSNQVPGWIRKVAIDRLADYLCMDEFKEHQKSAERKAAECEPRVRMAIFDLREPSDKTEVNLEMTETKEERAGSPKLDLDFFQARQKTTNFGTIEDGDYVTIEGKDRSRRGPKDPKSSERSPPHFLSKTWPTDETPPGNEPIYDNIPFQRRLPRSKHEQPRSDLGLRTTQTNKRVGTSEVLLAPKERNFKDPQTFARCKCSPISTVPLKMKNKETEDHHERLQNHALRDDMWHDCCKCRAAIQVDMEMAPCCFASMLDDELKASPLRTRERNRRIRRDAKEIKHLIRTYLKRFKVKDKLSKEQREWRIVARVVDRLFFLTYVIIITISLVSLLPKSEELRF